MSQSSTEPKQTGHQFGAFGGVFTPSILTIFGLIMFMRANYVIGAAGIIQALLILTLCCSITLLTGLSLSAISTNTPVSGGGAYFLISRVLGLGFGTAIGIALFAAQALSVPFYILGFVEAVVSIFPTMDPHFLPLCLVSLVMLFGITWVGAHWAIKVQYAVLTVLGLAIFVFMLGALSVADSAHFHANLKSHYQGGDDMWTMFSIYFPAVTGIMAGVNMSGDLKDPAKAIPRGTLAAVLVSYVVYAVQILLCGAMADAETLQSQPFALLVANAWLGAGFLVVAGVFSATLSSAVGSYLGAPRVLQALGKDGVMPLLTPFAHGAGSADEPRRALIATFAIGLVTLLAVGGQSGGNALNLVAAMVSMVFLYTYGMTNLAAFVESFGGNPSFRPRFRHFHWSYALAGAVGCIFAAVMINAAAAVLALAILAVLFLLARQHAMNQGYGDARRGFIYQRVRTNLLMLQRMPVHPKNWRPTVLVFSGNPNARMSLITYARWLGMNCGIVSLVSVVTGRLHDVGPDHAKAVEQLDAFVTENKLDVFPEVVVMEDFDHELALFLQSYSIGPIKPNVVLFGWPRDVNRLHPYYRHLRTVARLHKNIVIVIDRGLMVMRERRRIDCWWRGRRNGSLLVILAHLIQQNAGWRDTKLRVMRQVRSGDEIASAHRELSAICADARIEADVVVPVSDAPFSDVLRAYSADASLLMLGFLPPSADAAFGFHNATVARLEDMPSTILVASCGEADSEA